MKKLDGMKNAPVAAEKNIKSAMEDNSKNLILPLASGG